MGRVIHVDNEGVPAPSCRIFLSEGSSDVEAVVTTVAEKIECFDTKSEVNGEMDCELGVNSKIIPKKDGRYQLDVYGSLMFSLNNFSYTFDIHINGSPTDVFAVGDIKFASDHDNFSIGASIDALKDDEIELFIISNLTGDVTIFGISMAMTRQDIPGE